MHQKGRPMHLTRYIDYAMRILLQLVREPEK